MDIVKKILAPTDLSALSVKGVEYASKLAAALGAELIVWHGVRTDEFVSHARLLESSHSPAKVEEQLHHITERHKALLHEFVTRHLPDASRPKNFMEVVEMGEPHNLIVDWSKEHGVDLIVMSTHGRSGVPRMVLGSVTEKVLRHSACPVLAIPWHER